MMPAALGRARQYVTTAAAALGATPLADPTRRNLRWYFGSDSPSTASAVAGRLTCIGTAIQDTVTSNRFGCHPDDDTTAYVCVAGQAGSTAGSWQCADEQATICITRSFPRDDRGRAEVLIHEHAHRIGLSAGSHPDIYAFKPRFPYMSTEQSLMNSDSVALFAGAMTEGVRVARPDVFSVSGGTAKGIGAPDDEETWQARLYLGTEFRHPVLSIFNPTIGVGFTLIGDPRPETPGTIYEPSFLTSLVLGVRIEPPGPGRAPTPYLSLFGGPLVGLGPEGIGVGAEVGVAAGVRWRFLDLSVGVGRIYDPVRAAGLEPDLFTTSVTLSFVPNIRGGRY
jgi:hypothetical protein